MNDKWCILRTSGPRTLAVAGSLKQSGLDAWTPVDMTIKRVGKARERHEKPVAIMPTYVFANALHLGYLLDTAQAEDSPHPQFSVFHFHDAIPLIEGRELSHLRHIEHKAAITRGAIRFTQGERVTVPDGGFQGLTGEVVKTGGKYTLVAFPGFRIPVQVSTLHLQHV